MDSDNKFKFIVLSIVFIPAISYFIWLEVTGFGKYDEIISQIKNAPAKDIYPIKVITNKQTYIISFENDNNPDEPDFKQSLSDIQVSEWEHADDDSVDIDIYLNLSDIFILGFIEPKDSSIYYAYIGGGDGTSRIYGTLESKGIVRWLNSKGIVSGFDVGQN